MLRLLVVQVLLFALLPGVYSASDRALQSVHSVSVANNALCSVYAQVEFVNPITFETIVEQKLLAPHAHHRFRPKFFKDSSVTYAAPIAAVIVTSTDSATGRHVRIEDFHVPEGKPAYNYMVFVMPFGTRTNNFRVEHFAPARGENAKPATTARGTRVDTPRAPAGPVRSINFINFLNDRSLTLHSVYVDPRTNTEFLSRQPVVAAPASKVHIEERVGSDSERLGINGIAVHDGKGAFVISRFFAGAPTTNYVVMVAGAVDSNRTEMRDCISVAHGVQGAPVQVVCDSTTTKTAARAPQLL